MSCLFLPAVLVRVLVELALAGLGLSLARVDRRAARALLLAALLLLLASATPVLAETTSAGAVMMLLSQQIDFTSDPWVLVVWVGGTLLSYAAPPLLQATALAFVAYAMLRLRTRRAEAAA
jgi:hypothetical protein